MTYILITLSVSFAKESLSFRRCSSAYAWPLKFDLNSDLINFRSSERCCKEIHVVGFDNCESAATIHRIESLSQTRFVVW